MPGAQNTQGELMDIGHVPTTGRERREAYRVDGEIYVSCLKHDACKKCGACFKQEAFRKQSVNISEKGLRFYSDDRIREGSHIAVAVRFPNYALHELQFPEQCLVFQCRVIRATQTSRGYSVACEFLPKRNQFMINALSKYIFNRQREALTGQKIEDSAGYVVKKK
ncbi:MAG TPA: PilZ domain-containing protein [Dissulfurispiraceae bacterium]|nr:PilZ domain-containing protein [Dissulfurispiraceae bacterium]